MEKVEAVDVRLVAFERDSKLNRTLRQSYRHCAQSARRAASSFYWSFWLLPRAKRRAMCALYAFSRHTDDLSDNEQPVEIRRAAIAGWRDSLERALNENFDDPLFPALVDTLQQFDISPQYLHDIIEGVEMDLEPRRYQTFDDLREYCYRVASAVGLACIHIWGFTSEKAKEPAIKCGLAFQLTNILRDLKEDAARDRVYLPLDDLQRFDYSAEELLEGVYDKRLTKIIRFETDRAENLYRESTELLPYLHPDGQRALETMMHTYWQLLAAIRKKADNPMNGRINLPTHRKVSIALSAAVGVIRSPVN